MTQYVITPPVQPSVAVHGSTARFPVRRVFCVGRNYAEHAREMGHDPSREPPFFFSKPADAVVPARDIIPYPPLTQELHHEVELVVAISKAGVNIRPEDALEHVWGYGVGIDLTRRDLQARAKKAGRPWDWAKGFDSSAPCSPLYSVQDTGHVSRGSIWLSVNGVARQEGDLSGQIWQVAEIISHLSTAVRLSPGDLILTGTPSGVGVLFPGDRVEAGIDGVATVSFVIGAEAG